MASPSTNRPGRTTRPSRKTASKRQAPNTPSSSDSDLPNSPGSFVQHTSPSNGQRKQKKLFGFKLNLNQLFSRGLFFILIGLLLLYYFWGQSMLRQSETITVTQLVQDIRENKIERLEVAGEQLRAHYPENVIRIARKEDGQQALQIFEAAGIDLAEVSFEVENITWTQMAWELVLNLLPLVFMLVLFLLVFRQARGGTDGLMGIGRSKARVFVKGKQDVKFKDVGGMDEAKAELEEVVDFLRNPKKYKRVGARTPKGVLLVGPAGTGKTLLARAVAGEANVQFLSIAGSEFMEMLVGVGASRVRDLFTTAKKLAPSIIFIDEIDAIGRMRGHGTHGGHDEREQTLNQILVEMDGFTQNDNVIVMAATNRGDLLDPALVRPGRFDRRVTVNLPDLEERKYILRIHSQTKPFASDFDWERVARRTVGFSGADLENMLNEAAIAIARENRDAITMLDIEEASLKVKLGRSKKVLHDEHDRRMTAYHEAGHAVIAHVSPHADRVHRVSIVSRGRALGFTLATPERDKIQTTQSELLDELAVYLGGRAAEKIIFNELTAGARNDIERATRVARAMVTEYGMSRLGPVNFSPQFDTSDYNRAFGEPSKISDALQLQVDQEVTGIIADAEQRAVALLKKYRKQLDAVAEQLLDTETVDTEEFEKLMGVPKAKPHVPGK